MHFKPYIVYHYRLDSLWKDLTHSHLQSHSELFQLVSHSNSLCTLRFVIIRPTFSVYALYITGRHWLFTYRTYDCGVHVMFSEIDPSQRRCMQVFLNIINHTSLKYIFVFVLRSHRLQRKSQQFCIFPREQRQSPAIQIRCGVRT